MREEEFDIKKEAEYVLGLAELYPEDTSIRSMLRLKGLTVDQVDQVLVQVRLKFCEKRISQSRLVMRIGFLLFIISGSIMLYLYIMRNNLQLLSNPIVREIAKFDFYVLLFAIGQIIYGVYRYGSYRSRLTANSN